MTQNDYSKIDLDAIERRARRMRAEFISSFFNRNKR